MKKLIGTLIILLLVSVSAFAREVIVKKTYVTNNYTDTDPQRYGAKLDAPKLVHLKGHWYIGVEGGKDLNYTNAKEGWFAYGKITYTGTLLNLSKGE